MADFCHDAHGRLTTVNEPDGGPAPRCWLGRARDGVVVRCRHDVPADVVEHLTSLANDLPHLADLHHATDHTPLAEVLAKHGPVTSRWAGPAYRFPSTLTVDPGAVLLTTNLGVPFAPELAPWTPDLSTSQPCVGLVAEDHVVAICASVRITPAAHEAGVETAEAWRGRGYAATVVRAWAAAVRGQGAIPLYSTSWENVASQHVARAIGLRVFGTNLSLT